MKKTIKILCIAISSLILIAGIVFSIVICSKKPDNSNKIKSDYYENSDVKLTIDQKDFTTTESLQTITGSFKSNIDETIIAYEIQSIINNEVVSEFGNAYINENKYAIDNLRLIPGNNKIIVSIMDGENKILSKEINIFYDRGSYHEVDNNHIKVDKDTGITYIDNIILVYFEDDADEEKKHEIISSLNGNIVGHLNVVDQYQIEVKCQTLNELMSLCEELENNEFVYTASPDIQLDMSIESQAYIPNDPWTDSDEIVNWEENYPSGNNWWAEAIRMPSTWYYNDIFKTINIGIIDDGFDENHKELNIKYTNSDYQNNNIYNNHGTHVAGIISAEHNNASGISGIVDNCNIYTIPVNNRSKFLSSSLVDEISELIECRCKVINISMAHPSGGGVLKSYLLNKEQKRLTKALGNLLDNKYDFLISKAAGNKGKDTSDDLTIVLSHITEKNIKDRIIVVANATITNNGSYMLFENSNYGERIDIAAPGTNIYSTKVNGYTYMTGTSQAAPMVTGVAGLVWSINPNFTGAEVKEIVCNSVDTSVSGNPDNALDGYTYKLLNAKLSVETAIEKTDGYLYNCNVKFVDSNTKLTIPAKCTVYKATDEIGESYEKYRYVDYCETFYIELPKGIYQIDVTPLDDNHEKTRVVFTQSDSLNTHIINIDKKVTATSKPENSTTYVNEEYGWSVELPEEWNDYGLVVDNSVNPMLLTGADTVNFCHKEMYNSYGDGGIISILACPLEDYHNISDSSFYKKITENTEYVYLYHEFEIQFDTPLSSEKYDILLNEYNILHKAKDSILESFKLLN